MDILGPLPMALTHKCFMLALTDYYSKWIVVEAYASIKYKDVWMFVWKHIIYQKDILKEIVLDNGFNSLAMNFENFMSIGK